MNKTAIKNFAIWARSKLIAEIEYKAGLLGVRPDGVHEALPQSGGGTEFYDVGTKDPYALTGDGIAQRRLLVQAIREKEAKSDYRRAFQNVMEEVAYTWFNRLIAVRFMEVNDYLPSCIRVLSSSDGRHEPDIVRNPFDADLTYSEAEKARIVALKNDNKLDELFRLLFIKQCNALGDVLPYLFERTADYTELLLNVSFTDRDGVVAHLVGDIPESDFNISETDDEGNTPGQVEIIGWLYQYYNTEPKARVFSRPSTEKIKKEDIPVATQLYTPDWIVRYMVENSLGRLWLEGHPDEKLRSGWKYYLDEAEQEPELRARLEQLRAERRNINPEDIKLIDPCMGSGHILVYAFEVLMQIYQSQGWSARDAAQSILRHNLYGLDIDKRATQLAYFSLMMKARQYDRRFFERNLQPQVYCTIGDEEGEEYGSLVFVDDPGPRPEEPEGLFAHDPAYQRKLNAWSYRYLLAQKYDVVVTNPPYMGSSGMNSKLSEYVKKHFPNSKSDLFACFIERGNGITKPNRYNCMVTMQSWMFLSSFETMRKNIVNTKDITTLMHMENMVMGIAFGTAVTVFHNSHVQGYKGTYTHIKLSDITDDKPKEFPVQGNRFAQVSADNFSKIPGAPVAYWVSEAFLEAFQNKTIGEIAKPRQGLATGCNDIFIRLWHEVAAHNISYHSTGIADAKSSGKKWFPYNKGGDFRRWYGNNDYVVDWENDGQRIRHFTDEKGKLRSRPQNTTFYFKQCISWSLISSGRAAFRFKPSGNIFDVSGMSCFSEEHLMYLLCLCNSPVVDAFLGVLAPTINYQAGDIANIPVINNRTNRDMIEQTATGNIQLSKADWDSFETSWDFQRHPLVEYRHSVSKAQIEPFKEESWYLENAYEAWEYQCQLRFDTLKANEEELNRIFIDIYGLQDELTPEVEDKDVTVRRADLGRDVRSLLSYAVGCMFGRYSLDVPGLAFAGGDWDGGRYTTFLPDRDNVIPITDEEYFEDDIVGLLCAWLKKVYGSNTLEENLSFIAKALGGKGATSREVIRSYFLKDFFKDHCKIYQKRPIYWLYDSGKQNGFKALVYMHRYDPDTTGKVRADYLHRMEQVYESEIARMQETVDNSPNTREVAAATKRKEKLVKQLKECREYDEKIAHLALARIPIDLDDGVKVNYEKVQTGVNGRKLEILTKIM